MSDDPYQQYLRDLDNAASAVGSLPADYNALRELLNSLPRPTPPDVRSAGSPQVQNAAGTGGLTGAALSLQSETPIGSEQGTSLAVTQAPTIGLRNLFDDPRLDSVPFVSVALGAAFVNINRDWRAKFAAGTTGAGSSVFKGVDNDNATQDGLQSGTMILRFNNWTAAGTAVITANSDAQGGFFATYDPTVLPFVVFSCVIFKDSTWNQIFTNVTSLTVQLVIRDGSDTTDIAVSTPIDYKNMGLGEYVRHWVSADSAALGTTGYIATVRVTMVTSGALGGGNVNPSIANPQFELAPYQAPTVFLPAPRANAGIAFVNPQGPGYAVKAAAGSAGPGAFSSFRYNVGLGLSATNEGSIEFGGNAGSDNDIRIRRTAAGNLRFDTLAASPDFLIQQVAAAAHRAEFLQFVSGDSVERTMLGGDATVTGLELGPGTGTRDLRVARVGASQIKFSPGAATNDLNVFFEGPSGGRSILDFRVSGDTNGRTSLRGDAIETSMSFGPGNAVADWKMRRNGAKLVTVDDAAGGNATLNVVGTLQQSGTGVSVIGHGPADHANRTLAFLLRAEDATLDGATFVNVGASPNLSRVVNYADAATSGAFWTFLVPNDWTSGVLNVQMCWTPAATDAVAHTVRWSMTVKQINTGADVTAAGTTTAFTGASAARTVNIMVVDTLTSTGITPAAAGSRVMIEVQRIGADAADTYVGAVRLHGVIVSYTADQ